MVKVLKTGFYTTIQDLGRVGYSQYGVPISGAIDLYSAELANQILANTDNAALIESTMIGPQLQFYCDTNICITGANMTATLNGSSIKMNSTTSIKKNDVLRLVKAQLGFRNYIAVQGGFQTEEVLNSRSMYQTITNSSVLKKDDLLLISENSSPMNPKNASVRIDQNRFNETLIQVFKGPEFDLLSESNKKQLLSQEFNISKNNNRMAYQLEQRLENSLESIITSFVLPGTVQLTLSGQLIVLMRDCQTTGGYPRILQLKEASINMLGQKFTGQKIRFELVS